MAAAHRLTIAAAYLAVFLSCQTSSAYVLKDEVGDNMGYDWTPDGDGDGDQEYALPEDLRVTSVSVQMPNVEPLEDDMYICSAVTLPKDPSYIVGILPQINSDIVDRVWLVGCPKSPAKTDSAWSCSPDAPFSVCDGPTLVTYKWSRNSCPNYLAKGEILTVGGEFIRDMVLMIHYSKGADIDDSGLVLKMIPYTLEKDDVMYMMKYFGITLMTNSCDYDEDEDENSSYGNEELEYSVYDTSTEYPDGPLEELQTEAELKPETVDREPLNSLVAVEGWPNKGTVLGQVAGLDTDKKGNVHVFHRASRRWKADSFDELNVFTGDDPIQEDVVVKLDPVSGKVINVWGKEKFYLPHGLTVDQEDNVWLTDVAMHQVFKFPPGGAEQPLLSLGEPLVPGNDDGHLCKPTDVAVESKTGDFYVSDGYCNNRVLKFSANGTLISQWTGSDEGPPPHTFSIPHSLTLAEEYQQICVADRENGRIQCFSTDTNTFAFQISLPEFGGRVCAIDYNSDRKVIYAVSCPTVGSDPKGFTIDFKRRTLVDTWTPPEGFTFPHDVTSYSNSLFGPEAVYVGEVAGKDTLWKFQERSVQKRASMIM
ncbi:peptidyl-glycine alpha-amidating monooxygenase B-like [Glandiceps talaboti]